jgi:hypothetical protein
VNHPRPLQRQASQTASLRCSEQPPCCHFP